MRRPQPVVGVVVQGNGRDLQQRIAFGVESCCFDIHDHGQETAKAAGDFRRRSFF